MPAIRRQLRRCSLPAVAGWAILLIAAAVGMSPHAAASDNLLAAQASPAPATLVNPMIGTSVATTGGSRVNTFPGPDMPFGMIQWGPDTSPMRTNGGGYDYNSNEILGFSLDRLSGAGCPVYGDVPILPTVGAIPADPTGATMDYSHSDETAQVGYYAVTGTSSGATSDPVTTELTTTPRAGIGRFTFPASAQSNLLLKVADSAEKIVDGKPKYQKVDATTAQIVGDDEVIGSVTAGHFCNITSSKQRDYTLHFDIRFSQPFTSGRTWTGGPGTDPGGIALTFDTTENPTVVAKVGISYTSDANAAVNLAAEVAAQDFDAVRQANVQAWNHILGRIAVAGGTADQQAVFYTALYHSLLDPHVFSDVNGQYRGMDGLVHTVAHGHDQYADYSAWDIYRDEVQLVSMLAPHEMSDMVRSMLDDYDQGGTLPKWSNANGESYEMVGDPADPIIADAYAFGARDFDADKALQAMVAEATAPNPVRPGQSVLDEYGYLPTDMSYGCCNFTAAVSTQLEYDTADYAVASFAKATGHESDYRRFATRAQNWENAFNPATGYVQAKLANGQWAPGFTPGTGTGMIEGTSAQYTPMIPFNLHGVAAARGGDQAWGSYLDGLTANLTDPGPTSANLSNEPCLAVPWEYDYIGMPWKTQQVVRAAQVQLYANAPGGEPGNDDLGAMSSWYVWSALGMYPETPGTDTLVLGSPLFRHASVHLANGGDITIDAPSAAIDAPYVQSVQLNGQDWSKAYLTGSQFRHGAHLSFDVGTAPNTSWASGPAAAPPSDTTGQSAAIPYLAPSRLALSPGQTATASLGVRNITDRPVSATATTAPPAGIAVAPAGGTVRVPSGGTAQITLAVSVGADIAPGSYLIPITLTARDSASALPATLLVAVSAAGGP